jgi:hypothetical protein
MVRGKAPPRMRSTGMNAIHHRPATARAAATIQLYSRLWLELETWCGWMNESGGLGAGDAIDVRLETIRLELVLLLEACDSIRWKSMLRPEHLAALRADLHVVLKSLDAAADSPGFDAILVAQNRLFDGVVDQYAGVFEGAARTRGESAWVPPFDHNSESGSDVQHWLKIEPPKRRDIPVDRDVIEQILA